jgi:hypothetical protein
LFRVGQNDNNQTINGSKMKAKGSSEIKQKWFIVKIAVH